MQLKTEVTTPEGRQRMLPCSLCNEWKAVQDFNRRSRKLSVSILRAKTTQEDVFDVSMKYKLRCAACGEIAEIKK